MDYDTMIHLHSLEFKPDYEAVLQLKKMERTLTPYPNDSNFLSSKHSPRKSIIGALHRARMQQKFCQQLTGSARKLTNEIINGYNRSTAFQHRQLTFFSLHEGPIPLQGDMSLMQCFHGDYRRKQIDLTFISGAPTSIPVSPSLYTRYTPSPRAVHVKHNQEACRVYPTHLYAEENPQKNIKTYACFAVVASPLYLGITEWKRGYWATYDDGRPNRVDHAVSWRSREAALSAVRKKSLGWLKPHVKRARSGQ